MNIQEEFEKWYQVEVNFMFVSSAHPKYDAAKLAWNACAELMQAEIDKLKEELEDERIRLAACGVVALSNTRESAEKQRQMLDKYKSASLYDVIKGVDREMKYREELAALRNFSNSIIDNDELYDGRIISLAYIHGLLTPDGKTPLLTGK